MSYERLGRFIYIHHYIKAIQHEPVSVCVRLDEVASAITIWGLIAGCDYSKKITNIKFDGTPHQPYITIAKDFLKPRLGKLKDLWENTVNLNPNSSVKDRIIYQILNEILLPKITEKKICKSFIMPHVYGLNRCRG